MEYEEKVKNIVASIKGKLLIKEYPTKSVGVSTILAHANLASTMGYPVDMVIIDYADILSLAITEIMPILMLNKGEFMRISEPKAELGVPVWTHLKQVVRHWTITLLKHKKLRIVIVK